MAFESCPLSTSIYCRWHRHRFTDFKHVTQIETKLVDQLHNRSQWDFFPITRKANRRHWIWLRKLANVLTRDCWKWKVIEMNLAISMTSTMSPSRYDFFCVVCFCFVNCKFRYHINNRPDCWHERIFRHFFFPTHHLALYLRNRGGS